MNSLIFNLDTGELLLELVLVSLLLLLELVFGKSKTFNSFSIVFLIEVLEILVEEEEYSRTQGRIHSSRLSTDIVPFELPKNK